MKIGNIERIWLTLVGLTLVAAILAESDHPGWPLTLTVAALIALKSNLVVNHYMEITPAHPLIRRVLKGFVLIVVLLGVISHGAAETLRTLTTLN